MKVRPTPTQVLVTLVFEWREGLTAESSEAFLDRILLEAGAMTDEDLIEAVHVHEDGLTVALDNGERVYVREDGSWNR